ncbi:MAG TPA: bifunctional 5,10-methylenetetrahydrofolate dehydrogenase/5,10-methenyltetrahydrofolate cyclohydrolase [Candidatus Nanoarchaeia archaeon]|nr:bifunctional 5,10-methylenetetrahydrofolate dehydrogenase/5,10-methenyltetrahydrofolate cyclohydrolase [Candidatus Nanoarchaeia archaeon]
MAELLDGKKVSDRILEELKVKLNQSSYKPQLSIILCGDDPASILYTKMKKESGEAIGLKAEIHKLDSTITESEFIKTIEDLNQNSDGIMVQLPLPKHLNTRKIMSFIEPDKDVDGLTETSLRRIVDGDERFASATPKGIIKLLEEYNLSIEGKEITIINRSSIVGKPLALLFLNRGATVTICHSKTKNLLKHTRDADIIVIGVGKPNFLKAEMIKENCVVIDVGTNKTEEGLKGDVDFENVKHKASFITPVPGGVGPVTVAMLLNNIVNKGTKNL